MNNTIHRTANGHIFRCGCCNKIKLEFQNVLVSFEEKAYQQFKQSVKELDAGYWESINKDSVLKRKILVSFGNGEIKMLLNTIEVAELKSLLTEKKTECLIMSHLTVDPLCMN